MKENMWIPKLQIEAKKWNHKVYIITEGQNVTRRSIVIWSCENHSESGTHIFTSNNSKLKDLQNKSRLSALEVDNLVSLYPGQPFYASRIDEYLKGYKNPRTTCCRESLHTNRKAGGFAIFKKLLDDRGKHYKTKYTLLIGPDQYKGKLFKHPIKCEAHGEIFSYSMQALNYTTSCPCPKCRVDPNHKNICVDIVKKRNAGRPGQVIRHASNVKEKYNYKCFLTNSNFDLQHHHADGQDFYPETQLEWQHNGICLNATVHRDYHNNFLKNKSVISKEYNNVNFDLLASLSEGLFQETNNNPDLTLQNADVSRYTFLEYLRFLIFDIRKNNSSYVNALNTKIRVDYSSTIVQTSSADIIGKITLEFLEKAIEQFSAEYKAKNWALAERNDIFNANNSALWAKVDNTWV